MMMEEARCEMRTKVKDEIKFRKKEKERWREVKKKENKLT